MSTFKSASSLNEEAEEEDWDEYEEPQDAPTPTTRKKNAYYEDSVSQIQSMTTGPKPRRGRVTGDAESNRRYGEATELFVDGKVEEAKTVLTALIADHPAMAAAYRTLGLIHQELGEYKEAASNFEIAGEKTKDGENFIEAAKLYRRVGDSAKAFTCFGKASKLLQTDVFSLTSRAEILLAQNQPKKAISELTVARERDPKNLVVLEVLARAYDSVEDRVAELEVLSTAYSRLVSDSEMGSSSLMAASNAKGYRLPEHMPIIVAYAKALVRRREWQQVMAILDFADLRRGLRQLPIELSFFAAICKVHMGDISDARNQINNRLLKQELEPWSELFMQLVDALFEQHEWDDALHVLIQLAEASIDRRPIWTRMAECYEQKGEFHNSAHYYELCFELDKTNVTVCLSLARMYDKMGLLDRGIQVVQQYEKLSGQSIGTVDLGAPVPQTSVEPTADELKRVYEDIDSKMMIAVQKAKLFFSKREYLEFVDILTPVLSNSSMWFNRHRRRKRSQGSIEFEAATKRKSSKKSAAQTPLDSVSGISSVQVPSSREPSNFLEEADEDEFMANDDETMEHGDNEELQISSSTASKKRKREEFEPTVMRREDPLDEVELVTYESTRHRWAIPTQARLQEMKSRKNVWEICGMTEFVKLLTDYCKCLLFLSQASRETLHIVDTLLNLVSTEQESANCEITLMGDLWFHVAQVAYAADNFDRATRLMRTTCQTFPDNIHLWNFFFRAVNRTRDFFLSRGWVLRQVNKKPDCVPLQLLYGHLSLMSRGYHFSVIAYLNAFSNSENFDSSSTPLMLLCTAVAFICRAMSRTNKNKNGSVVKAFAFFYKYFIEQYYGGGNKHEAYYNMARAFHYISLYQYAIPLYEKVLMDTSHLLQHYNEIHEPHHQYVASLQREAAYNLAMIYRQSGSQHLARKLMMDYLTF